MRIVAASTSLAALAIAGCGAGSERSAVQPAPAHPDSKVFTVPAELPPRAKAPEVPKEVGHNPDTAPVEGAPSDAQVQRELAEALGVDGDADVTDQAGLTEAGMATVPPSAPAEVARIINAANQVAHAPYRYGGGHGGVGGSESWVDTAYDCSGSVSFALASAGLLDRQLDSTSFMSWGKSGPGKWVTIFANEGHAFMVVAGLRFDTVERARTGTRWGQAYSKVSGFVARHPPGF